MGTDLLTCLSEALSISFFTSYPEQPWQELEFLKPVNGDRLGSRFPQCLFRQRREGEKPASMWLLSTVLKLIPGIWPKLHSLPLCNLEVNLRWVCNCFHTAASQNKTSLSVWRVICSQFCDSFYVLHNSLCLEMHMRASHLVSFCVNYLIISKGKKGDKIILTMAVLVQPES